MREATPDLGEMSPQTLSLLKALAVSEGPVSDPAIDADDIAQEAAVTVWERSKEEAVGIGLAAVVVRRRRTDAYRRRKPTASLATLDEDDEGEWPTRATVAGPEERVVNRMEAAQLMRGLEATTRKLVVEDAMGYRGRELGRQHRLSEANVHQRLSRARRQLRHERHAVR